MGFWGIVFVVLGVLVGIAVVALAALAIVQVVRDRSITWQARLSWSAAIVALPLGGALAWFAVGHRTREFEGTFAR